MTSSNSGEMMAEEIKQNVKSNLMLLLSSCNSVADLCRRVAINRQQFNKYLAGQHTPSRATLLRIAHYFQRNADDFYLAPQRFRALWQSQGTPTGATLPSAPAFHHFLSQARLNVPEMEAFYGVYHRYHYSSIYKGQLLRSITVIYPQDGAVAYTTVERFPQPDAPTKTGYLFRYTGFCFLMGDRIFMVDSEQKQHNEMTFTILTPQHRRPVRFLHGIVSGIASTSFRQPFSSRIIFQRKESKTLTKSLLRTATVLRETDGVPREVLDYLNDEQNGILWGGAG